MNIFRFVLLTLSAYRLTRLITTDAITEDFRDWVGKHFGEKSKWFTLVGCPWCVGVYISSAVFLVERYLWQPPMWMLGMVAAYAIIGLLGTYDER